MPKGRIEIETDRCKGCELCMMVCPKNLISPAEGFNIRGYHPAQFVDPDGQCTGCALCALMCPDVVITVYREKAVKPAEVADKAAVETPRKDFAPF